MAARVIDGKAVAAAVRERVKVDVAAYARGGGPDAGPGDGAGRRRPGLGDLRRATSGEACEEVGMRSIHHGPDGLDPRGGAAGAGRER